MGPNGASLYALAADGTTVAAAGGDATVYLYDVRTWTQRAR
jgi:hypothetical protein